MAPPAGQIPTLIQQLLKWLKSTKVHPLVASCITHYEIEFIHPFSDGNGRIGRMWQSLILHRWQPILSALPVETLIRDRQKAYYGTLAKSDSKADCGPFIEFMLEALRDSLERLVLSNPGTDPVTDPVAKLLRLLTLGEKQG